ncbi:unnamed protein product, partial [Ceratitis capitata]
TYDPTNLTQLFNNITPHFSTQSQLSQEPNTYNRNENRSNFMHTVNYNPTSTLIIKSHLGIDTEMSSEEESQAKHNNNNNPLHHRTPNTNHSTNFSLYQQNPNQSENETSTHNSNDIGMTDKKI